MTSTETKARHRQIYAEYLTGKYIYRELAEKFGVSIRSIERVINKHMGLKDEKKNITIRKAKFDKRQSVLKKFDGKCAYCGCNLENNWQVDHIIPKWHYDRNIAQYPIGFQINGLENLNPTCPSCNNYKNGNDLETFRKEIAAQIERLRRDKPTFRLAERYGLIECKPVERVVFYFETLTLGNISLK